MKDIIERLITSAGLSSEQAAIVRDVGDWEVALHDIGDVYNHGVVYRGTTLYDAQRAWITQAVAESPSIAAAARRLGVGRSNLHHYMKVLREGGSRRVNLYGRGGP